MAHAMRACCRLVGTMLAVVALTVVTRALAQERRVYGPAPAQTREIRLLIFPVDFTDAAHMAEVPNHLPWQTARYISDAFFAPNLDPRDAMGRRLVMGSIADFVARNVPGTRLTGEVYRYRDEDPHDGDGWYRFALREGMGPYFGRGSAYTGEAGGVAMYQDFFRRLGFDPVRPSFMRANGGRFDGVYFIHGGGGGSVRAPFGWPLGNSGFGNDPATIATDTSPRYNWIGTTCHEVMHWITDLADFYGPVWEQDTAWDILSVGNALGAFPAPMAAWMRHMVGYERVEQAVPQGQSANIRLPNPSRSAPMEMLVLNNSSVGTGDELIVEYRNHSPDDGRHDTSVMGVPPDSASGLLIADFDRHARGYFFSTGNENGGLPDAFRRPREDTPINPYSLTPIVQLKHADGYWEGTRNVADTFMPGAAFVGWNGDDTLLPLKSSANRHGDVVWELRNLRLGGDSFSFDAQFQGRSLADEATSFRARWQSAAGAMRRDANIGLNPVGIYYAQPRYDAGDAIYRDVLWALTNRQSSAGQYWAEGTFAHEIPYTGEQLVARVIALSATSQPLPTGAVRVMLFLSPLPAGGASQRTQVLDATFPPAPGRVTQLAADLTRWAGQTVNMTLRIEGNQPVNVGLADAHFYRKAERVLHDFVNHLAATRPPSTLAPNAPVTDPNGALGIIANPRLVDGVSYDRGLYMRPRTVSRGRVTFTADPVRLPTTGAILRGSVGYPLEALGSRSDGAMLRLTVDDGVHKLPLREWTPPLLASATYLAPGTETGVAAFGRVLAWGDALVWPGEAKESWTRDWMRSGDVDGDGRDDIIVFSGDDRGRVGVALSRPGGPAPLEKWHDYFAPAGEYPLVGRFDRDNKADIVTFTRGGDAYVALSTGTAFGSAGGSWATGLLVGNGTGSIWDVPLVGDVTGDGLDDVVIFSRSGALGREAGSVWVARNTGAGQFRRPTQWLAGRFCPDDNEPLVGDLNGDGKADIASLDMRAGMVVAALSQGTTFGTPSVWLRDGGPRRAADAVASAHVPGGLAVSSTGPHPGTNLAGPVCYLARSAGAISLVWFNRSEFPDEPSEQRVGHVHAARSTGSGFAAPVRIHGYFAIGREWPLVGDFDGNRRMDLVTTTPAGANVPDWYYREAGDWRPELRYPGDLYISAKEGDIGGLSPLPPRVRRFAIDLAAFRGRTITLEITVDAGPSPDYDMLVWPDLKLYERPGLLLAMTQVVTEVSRGAQTAPGAQGRVGSAGAASSGSVLLTGIITVGDVPKDGLIEWRFRVTPQDSKEPLLTPTERTLVSEPASLKVTATVAGLKGGATYAAELEVLGQEARSVAAPKFTTKPTPPQPPVLYAAAIPLEDLRAETWRPPKAPVKIAQKPDAPEPDQPKPPGKAEEPVPATTPVTVETLPPDVHDGATATLRGLITGPGQPLTWHFQVTDSAGKTVILTSARKEAAPNPKLQVSRKVGKLAPGRDYLAYFIVEADGQKLVGDPAKFTTPGGKQNTPAPGQGNRPRLTVVEVAGVTAQSATAVGEGSVSGDAKLFFRVYSADGKLAFETVPEVFPAAGERTVTVKHDVPALAPGSQYRIVLVCATPTGEFTSAPKEFWTDK